MNPPPKEFAQQGLDPFLRDDLEQLVRLAIREDLGRGFDLTTLAVVPEGLQATARVIPRVAGVAAGISLVEWIIESMETRIGCSPMLDDGQAFAPAQPLVELTGDARDLLTCERTLLNILGRLCGVATWTQQHVARIADLPTRLYDTRKTTPGWRRLEKYAVRCGGAWNHRLGLNAAILIKDNHLACHQHQSGQLLSPSQAVERARSFLAAQPDVNAEAMLEVEVDTLDQLRDALQASPDIILLDNMSLAELRTAVKLRDSQAPQVQLEASGGVHLDTLRDIAETGVDRISVGALTHSAINLDLGLDWELSNAFQFVQRSEL